MLKLRRVKTKAFKTTAFWLREKDGKYIAYRSLAHAILRIESPSIMSAGQEAMKRAYEARKI